MHQSIVTVSSAFITLLATLAHAQQPGPAPTPVTPSVYIPIIVPTGTSLAASIVTTVPDQVTFQVQCQDPICSNDAPATAWIASSSYSFGWTASDNPGNRTAYNCPLTKAKATTDQVQCTLTVGDITTAHSYPISALLATQLPGAGQAVAITAGADKMAASDLTCDGTECASSQIPTQGPNAASQTASGSSSSGPASVSATATGTPSGSATGAAMSPTGGADKVGSGVGAAMAAAALAGALAL